MRNDSMPGSPIQSGLKSGGSIINGSIVNGSVQTDSAQNDPAENGPAQNGQSAQTTEPEQASPGLYDKSFEHNSAQPVPGRGASENDPMHWEHPQASNYSGAIAAKIPGYLHLYEMAAGLLKAALDKQSAHILIVGAGGGQELETLGGREPGWRFTGVDTSERMLEAARRRIAGTGIEARAALVRGEIEKLPALEPRLHDGATCLLVLHFVQGIEAKKSLLRAIADRLPPGAPLLIASVNADYESPAFAVRMEAWRLHMLSGGISEEEWLRFADSLGRSSDPLPGPVVLQLLEECGFYDPAPFFASFLVGGWITFKREADTR
ncbi:class I SAM-dependent methyltransferase [Saccharibacillus sp. CPCC 101409]|uniref:class I SAM-dependent methyltransferase n=1 Tax=Saccharibacillus sp. CPCC 101409 TaxID=3058041 RepID=UPI0026737659|nr:class I SAM-dependent methyltransferase [Saccharibacillus sp. CPCC 101409]MDO3411943.1 class I SAM-dependent methyltransferase [Saccharibacillus sp. CPCC 101409]